MSHRSPKNHLNLMLPSQEGNKQPDIVTVVTDNARSGDSSPKLDSIDAGHFEIPSIVQVGVDAVAKSDSASGADSDGGSAPQQQPAVASCELLNTLYLTPSAVSPSVYLNRVSSDWIHRNADATAT